jgi:hypothetical protein
MAASLPAYDFNRQIIHTLSEVVHPTYPSVSLPTVPQLDQDDWVLPITVDQSQQDDQIRADDGTHDSENFLVQVPDYSPESPIVVKSIDQQSDMIVDVELTSPDERGVSLKNTLFALNRLGRKSYNSSNLEYCDLSSSSRHGGAFSQDYPGFGEQAETESSDELDDQEAIAHVKVNRYVVAEFPYQGMAHHFAESIKAFVASDDFRPETLMPKTEGNGVMIAAQGGDISIPLAAANPIGQSPNLLAIAWTNNLRVALGVEPLSMGDAQAHLQSLEANGRSVKGIASWYGPYFHGRLTASGEIFDQNELTAAHPSLPFDTYLNVTNLQNGRSVVVRINDRGPYMGRRSLDLSRRAARCLDSEEAGIVPYVATFLEKESAMVAAWQQSDVN